MLFVLRKCHFEGMFNIGFLDDSIKYIVLRNE